MLLVFIICFNSGADAAAAIGGLIAVIGLIYLVRLLKEVGSYFDSIRVKKVYFSKMRETIIRSDNYEQFVQSFYGR